MSNIIDRKQPLLPERIIALVRAVQERHLDSVKFERDGAGGILVTSVSSSAGGSET